LFGPRPAKYFPKRFITCPSGSLQLIISAGNVLLPLNGERETISIREEAFAESNFVK
jgi:hypothetical protein